MIENPMPVEIHKEEFSEEEKECYQRFLEEIMNMLQKRVEAVCHGSKSTSQANDPHCN